MASKIVFDYDRMNATVGEIQAIAEEFKSAATQLESDFQAATSGWEGDSKEKMNALISGAVMSYARDDISTLLNGLAELLKANADQMANADQQIAASIPQSLS